MIRGLRLALLDVRHGRLAWRLPYLYSRRRLLKPSGHRKQIPTNIDHVSGEDRDDGKSEQKYCSIHRALSRRICTDCLTLRCNRERSVRFRDRVEAPLRPSQAT